MLFSIEEVLKRFERYINTDSNSYCKEDVDCISRIIEAESCKAGFSVIRHKQQNVGDFLEVTVGSGQKNILLLGHMDTVFPCGTSAARPFTHDDTRVYGPGVLDMKGGVLIAMLAMEAIARSIPAEYSITALFNSEEEIGSPHSNALIKEKAVNSIASLSFEGVVPGFLTTERNGILSFEVRLEGVTSHAGVAPHLGRSAVEEAANKIQRIYGMRDKARSILVNIGKISGGAARNIVAGDAQFIGEVRYINPADRDELLNTLMNIVNTSSVPGIKSEITILSNRPPMKSDEGCRRLFEMIRDHAANMGHELVSRKTGGGGDAAFVSIVGTPVVDGMGPEGDGAHTDNEYILLDSIEFKTKLTIKTLCSIMGIKDISV